MILTQLILLSFPSWKSLSPEIIAWLLCNLFGSTERIFLSSAIMCNHAAKIEEDVPK